MRTDLIRNTCVSLTLLIVASACLATNAEPLDLTEAIQRAVQAAPELAAQGAGVESAKALVRPAGQLPDPELSFGIDDMPITGADAGSLSTDSMTMRRIGVMQQLPRRAKRDLRTRLANDTVEALQAEQEQIRLTIARDTAQAWIDAHTAQQTLQRFRALQPEYELQARIAVASVQSGRTTSAQALAIDASVFDFRDRVLSAEQDLQRARAMLQRWLPQDSARPLGIAPDFAVLSVTPEQLLTATHEHASVLIFDAQLDAARTSVELARAEKQPDWSVGIDYGHRGSMYSDMVSVQFRVPLQLRAGQRQDPVIASKYAELRKVESAREAELRMHRAEVESRLIQWQSLQARLANYQSELVPLARTRVQVAQAAYESARTNVQPLLEARAAEIEVELRTLELQRQLGHAWAFLNYLRPRSAP